jgi:hypothetical protein
VHVPAQPAAQPPPAPEELLELLAEELLELLAEELLAEELLELLAEELLEAMLAEPPAPPVPDVALELVVEELDDEATDADDDPPEPAVVPAPASITDPPQWTASAPAATQTTTSQLVRERDVVEAARGRTASSLASGRRGARRDGASSSSTRCRSGTDRTGTTHGVAPAWPTSFGATTR